MLSKKDRLRLLIRHLSDGNSSAFARYLGVSPQTISSWLNRDTFDIELVYSKCSTISADWLLSGNGEMLLRDTKPIGRAKSDPTTICIDNTDKDATIQLQREHIELLKEKIVRLTEDVVFTGVRSTTKDSDVVLDEPWPPVNNPQKKRESP